MNTRFHTGSILILIAQFTLCTYAKTLEVAVGCGFSHTLVRGEIKGVSVLASDTHLLRLENSTQSAVFRGTVSFDTGQVVTGRLVPIGASVAAGANIFKTVRYGDGVAGVVQKELAEFAGFTSVCV